MKIANGHFKLYKILNDNWSTKRDKASRAWIGLTPESVKVLTKKGHEVLVQFNGGRSRFTNEDYKNAGAVIIKNARKFLKVRNYC